MIIVQVSINAPLDEVWEKFTNPNDIVKWYNASDDWHTPKAENDLQIEGKFNYRMEAKDGSFGFNFSGVYKRILEKELLEILLDDGRLLNINFGFVNNNTIVTESFDPEKENPEELQKQGWQAILTNFKKYVEGS